MLIDFFYTLRAGQAAGVGQGIPGPAGSAAGRRGRPRSPTDAGAWTTSTTWRAPLWSRTRSTSTSSTAPSRPTSRAWRCWPTSRKEIPADWLRKLLERELTARAEGRHREDGLGRADGDAEKAPGGAKGAATKAATNGSAPAAPAPLATAATTRRASALAAPARTAAP